MGVVVEPVGHRNCRVPGTRRPPRMTSLVTRIVGHLRGRGSALWPLVPSLALPGREGTGLSGGPFIVPAAARLLLATLAPLRDLAHSRWAPTSGPRATSDRGAVSIPTSSCAIAPARCDHTRRRWAATPVTSDKPIILCLHPGFPRLTTCVRRGSPGVGQGVGRMECSIRRTTVCA